MFAGCVREFLIPSLARLSRLFRIPAKARIQRLASLSWERPREPKALDPPSLE
jgi:hypothetical protein